ncbi:hypothetical protein EJ02DRAFT_459337 [Clathrospora elynae]|uniref:Uncharacterized protein n=1 Tax=Clathrospora elynae TaxID=706981 RepID=A0A6A5SB28_9PLEO|nr:hypothetical protein EJ02DRAFT_459337 [Clathrospora elynae]
MATFTSVPQATSFQFRQYDPTLLKRTKSKAKAKVTGHTLCRDGTEGPTYNLGLLHQDTEGDLHAVPIADVEEMDFAMCGPFGADHTVATSLAVNCLMRE